MNTLHDALERLVLWLKAGLSLMLTVPALALGASDNPAPWASPMFKAVGEGRIPRGVVASLAQDRAGFLWIGTGDGLVRYDGYRFQPQLRQPAADAIAGNLGWVQALLATPDGRVWIGTEALGLAVYEPASDAIRLVDPIGAADAPRQIVALAQDLDGAVWSASLSGGVDRHDPATGARSSYRQADRSKTVPDDRVQALLVDRSGDVWLGTWRGLARLRRGGDAFEPVFAQGADILAGHIVQSLLQAADGRIWAGTRAGAVAVVDPATGQGVLLDAQGGAAVASLAQRDGGPVWVGRASGIDWVDPTDGRLLRRLRHDPRAPDGLAANQVTSLLVDRDGRVWVGGLGLGLQVHDPGYRGLAVRRADTGPGALLDDANSRSLLALPGGGVLVGTPGDLFVLDADLRTAGRLVLPARQGQAPPTVEAMARSSDGHLWIARVGSLVELDTARRPRRTWARAGGRVHSIVPTRDGSVWLCAVDGLYRLARGTAEPVRVDWRDGKPLTARTFAAVEDADGGLWVGTLVGLLRVPPGGDRVDKVPARPGAGLTSPVVTGLLIDRQQRLWLDTGIAGLHRMTHWDGQSAAFDAISRRLGIAGKPFGVNLLADEAGRIWTQQFVYDPAADRVHELAPSKGGAFGTGWFFSYAQLDDGRMLFGGSKGILVVEPRRFAVTPTVPPLVVSELRVDGNRRAAPPRMPRLQMAPDERSFSVEFAALDFGDQNVVRYRWRLQGLDRHWNEGDASQRVVSYANLAPGGYRLEVFATNGDGAWSARGLAIDVDVLPAWWQRSAVRLTALLAVLLAVIASFRWRTRHLRRRQHELEAKVRERTASLERLTIALQQESAALQEASLTDPLTGLRNRRFVAERLDADAEQTILGHEAGAGGALSGDRCDLLFFLVDIDYFKQVNDLHGHAAGDALLTQIRGRLESVFRETDYIVRWGGEEFLVVARATHRDHAATLAERARLAVADPPFTLPDGQACTRTASIGFACFPLASDKPRAVDWRDTIALADAALYEAKLSGRDAWVGVCDVGTLDVEPLRDVRPVADWLKREGWTLLRSRTRRAPA